MSTRAGLSDARDPFSFGEKVLNLLDEGAFTATYKYAVLLGLIDLCMEHSSSDGSAPTAVTTQDLARKILELYWPQTSPFVSRDRAKILAQNTKGQAEILRLITRFRERHAPDPSAPISQARLHAKERFERLVREVEWKLVEMPLTRLQTVGTSDDPFLYRIGWTRDVKRAEFVSSSFDNRIQFIEGSGEYLVQLAGLLRPLVQRQWARMVSRLNEDVIQDARLEEFLFGATRISLDRVRQPLREFQENRCFYCETPIRGPAKVDHFIPWARHPDNGIENLVAADGQCNNDKRDFVASTEHLQRRRAAHFDADGQPVEPLEQISSTLGWESHPDRTLAGARSIYLKLPEGTKLWDHGREFTGLKQEAVRAALGAAV
jgi:HNH endonuclease